MKSDTTPHIPRDSLPIRFPTVSIALIVSSIFLFLSLSGFAQSESDSLRLAKKMDEVNGAYAAGKYEQSLTELRAAAPLFQQLIPDEPAKEGNFYRSMAHVHFSLQNVDSALIYERRAWENFRTHLGDSNKITIDVHYELGYLYDRAFVYDSALKHYQGALQAYEWYVGEGTDDIPLTLHQIATVYRNLGKSEEVLSLEQRAYRLWEALYGENSDRALTATQTLSQLYEQNGKLGQALIYAQKTQAIANVRFAAEPAKRAAYVRAMASLYERMGEDSLWLGGLRQAADLLAQSADPPANEKAWLSSSWGKYYRQQKQYPRARRFFHQALSQMKTYGDDSPLGKVYQADFMIQLAQIFIDEGLYDSTTYYLDQATVIYDQHYPQRSYYPRYERLHVAAARGDTTALFQAAEALLAQMQEQPTARGLDTQLLQPITGYPETNRITVLMRQADILWKTYEEYGKARHLEWAMLAFEQLDRWYDPVQSDRIQPDPKSNSFGRWINKGLMRSYTAQYQRNGDPTYLARAFAAAERNHSFSLYVHLRHQSHLQFAGVPDSLVQREASLRAQLAFLSSRLLSQNKSETDAQLSNQLLYVQKAYESLTERLRKEHPAYFSLMNQAPADIGQFQEMLTRNQGAVTFSIADSMLYSFVLSATQANCVVSRLPANFSNQILEYRQLLTDYQAYLDAPVATRSAIGAKGHELFRLLLATPLQELPPSVSELILIPGGELTLLPFETLPTTAVSEAGGSFADFPFLIRRYHLSYGYSASLYLDQHLQTFTAQRGTALASFAPSYDNRMLASLPDQERTRVHTLVRDGWYDLKGAKGEAQAIADLWNGDLFLAEQASRHQFLEAAPQYNLLHLAMHTSVQQENPLLSSLIFSASDTDTLRRLYAADLFALKLHTEMVVLSGCNTGLESEDPGLGNFSLARAFQYAGSPSVVMSLWKVPDAATQELMLHFYKNLKGGDRKSEALRQAKLAYLSETQQAELTHPFYWAGFVSSGNNEPLAETQSGWMWKILIGLLVLAGLLGGVYWRRNKNGN